MTPFNQGVSYMVSYDTRLLICQLAILGKQFGPGLCLLSPTPSRSESYFNVVIILPCLPEEHQDARFGIYFIT